MGGGACGDGNGVAGKWTDEYFGVGAGEREINREVGGHVVLVFLSLAVAGACRWKLSRFQVSIENSAFCFLMARLMLVGRAWARSIACPMDMEVGFLDGRWRRRYFYSTSISRGELVCRESEAVAVVVKMDGPWSIPSSIARVMVPGMSYL